MTAMPRLALDDVAKRYGRRAVLDGVSLEVESGETVVVCGPSGAGKTVLLRLIAGTDAARPRRHPDRRRVRARPAAPRSATSAWRSRTSRSTRT